MLLENLYFISELIFHLYKPWPNLFLLRVNCFQITLHVLYFHALLLNCIALSIVMVINKTKQQQTKNIKIKKKKKKREVILRHIFVQITFETRKSYTGFYVLRQGAPAKDMLVLNKSNLGT